MLATKTLIGNLKPQAMLATWVKVGPTYPSSFIVKHGVLHQVANMDVQIHRKTRGSAPNGPHGAQIHPR